VIDTIEIASYQAMSFRFGKGMEDIMRAFFVVQKTMVGDNLGMRHSIYPTPEKWIP
jgi:hypothetical protein